MSGKDLLALPDEVKLKIFQYLDAVSKNELSKVCVDLARIYQDRQVMQRLNFSRNYKTRLAHFKLNITVPLYKLVTHLNLTSIYWIQSAQMRYVLVKFSELMYLNVTDTQLSFRDLGIVLDSATKVTKLAVSLRNDHCSDVLFLKLDQQITHFYVTYSSFAFRALVNVLNNFTELEELWIVEPRLPDNIQLIQELPWSYYTNVVLPKVSKKIVLTKQSMLTTGASSLVTYLKTPGNWVQLHASHKPIFLVTEKYPDGVEVKDFNTQKKIEEQLSFLSKEFSNNCMFSPEDIEAMLSKKCSYSEYYFNYINLTKCYMCCDFPQRDKPVEFTYLDKCTEAFETILFSKNMSRLKKLKLGCLIAFNKKTAAESSYLPLFKKPRIGSGSSTVTEDCLLSRLSQHLSEIEELEIIRDHNIYGVIPKWEWQPNCLKFIKNWKMLKRLTLTSLPLNNGKLFIEITRNCPFLSRLKIKDDSLQDKISYDLCNALDYAKNLVDFRYERGGASPIDDLFNALKKCVNLERVYIQCTSTKSISKRPLETLLSTCEHLVFFFIYITELLETVCKTIKQSMSHFDIKPLQIFTIRGRAYNINNITYDDIPSIHVQEMVCQSDDFCEYLHSF